MFRSAFHSRARLRHRASAKGNLNQGQASSESKEHPLAAAPRPEPSFRYLDLPPPLFALISSFFNQKDSHFLNLALVGFLYRNYKSPALTQVQFPPGFLFRQFKAIPHNAKLLHAVITADYEQAKQIIKDNPTFIFQAVNFLHRNGQSEQTSPLKYAFKVYDTYMWTLFYERIKGNSQWEEEFSEQMLDKNDHLDLTPFFSAYDEFELQRYLWLRGKMGKIADKIYNGAWLAYGAEQKKHLPAHMLKEYSREDNTWSAVATFDAKTIPAPAHCRIYSDEGKWIPLSSILTDPHWGISFALVRFRLTENGCAIATKALRAPSAWHTPGEDVGVFRRLYEVRIKELTDQISLRLEKKPAPASP